MTPELTKQQKEIVDLLAEGLTANEIAQRLYVAPGTVNCQLQRAYARVGARNAAHLVAIELKRGLSND